jgi:hypothetical protein
MAQMTVFHQASPEAEVEQWEIDWDSLTIGEVLDLEKHSGLMYGDFKNAFMSGSVTALVLVVYVIRRRTEPKLTLHDMRSAQYSNFAVRIDAEGEGNEVGGDSGKAPSDAPESDTP